MSRIGASDDDSRRPRRVPRRWIATIAVVGAVVASERWDGPLTLDAVRAGVSSAAEAAGDRLGLDDESSQIPAGSGTPVVHLTFDDGPHPTYTPQILDVLARYDARAVFFPVGDRVADGAELLRRAVAEGHRIGNHTWAHDDLSDIDEAAFERAVGRTQVAVAGVIGETPRCLRPPGGRIDGRTAELAADAGLSLTMWTVDPHDWDSPATSTIVERVLTDVDDGSVVLLHDGGGDQSRTVAALATILDELSDRGYRFTSVPGC